MLFNLKNDSHELKNLAEEEPQILKKEFSFWKSGIPN